MLKAICPSMRANGARNKVCCPTERQVSITRTEQIQAIGVGKPIRVAICGSQSRYKLGALADVLASKFHICRCDARGVLYRRLVAQQFVHRGGNDLGMTPKLLQGIGVAQKRLFPSFPGLVELI
jgi:hypothetical protein